MSFAIFTWSYQLQQFCSVSCSVVLHHIQPHCVSGSCMTSSSPHRTSGVCMSAASAFLVCPLSIRTQIMPPHAHLPNIPASDLYLSNMYPVSSLLAFLRPACQFQIPSHVSHIGRRTRAYLSLLPQRAFGLWWSGLELDGSVSRDKS